MSARREFLRLTGLVVSLGSLPLAARIAFAQDAKLKIGTVGSGRVGAALGGAWIKAGHEVMFSSLDL